jgi:hypothetical protein
MLAYLIHPFFATPFCFNSAFFASNRPFQTASLAAGKVSKLLKSNFQTFRV